MEYDIIEHKMIDRFVDMGEEAFHLATGNCKVLMCHFFKVGSFLVVGVEIVGYDVPHLLDCVYIMGSFVFLVVAYAALGLADG